MLWVGQLMVVASLPVVHESFAARRTAVSASSTRADDESTGNSDDSVASQSERQMLRDLRWPVGMLLLGHALNNMAYMTEWALFAAYFKQVHGTCCRLPIPSSPSLSIIHPFCVACNP